MKNIVRVGINGYGVIGKRVADAVALQEDMELIGVSDIAHDYRIRVAVERGYEVFSPTVEKLEEMRAAGIPASGTLDSLLEQIDVIIDCTPKKVAEANRSLYEKARVKVIYQGGERHEVAGYSFVAQANYAGALGRPSARVVSCNTTGIIRTIGALHMRGLVKKARVVILRRATDPWESHRDAMINTVIPETKVPSHQGPDARTVIPDLNLATIAAAGSHNLSHIHFAMVEAARPTSIDEVHDVLSDAPRIAFVQAKNGLVALNSVIELMRDLGRLRADMWEVAVWEDSLMVEDGEIYLTYQVHNEAIVVPENIDAVRALTEIEEDGYRSIRKTDASLGVAKNFLPASEQVSILHVAGPDVSHLVSAAVVPAHAVCAHARY